MASARGPGGLREEDVTGEASACGSLRTERVGGESHAEEDEPTVSSPTDEEPLFGLHESLIGARVRVLDLFSGIDSLGHALEKVLPEEFRKKQSVTIMFETDPKCRKFLMKNRC